MKTRRFLAVAVLLSGAGCSDGSETLGPTAPHRALSASLLASSAAAGALPAAGEFTAVVDFSTLSLTPKGRNCLLVVDGQLVFTGTIEGVATGTTTAMVFAPCAEVASTPPGTHPDAFHSELEFAGTIEGAPAEGRMMYLGGVEEGGAIDARISLSRGLAGVLEVDAVVAVGGTYYGRVVTR